VTISRAAGGIVGANEKNIGEWLNLVLQQNTVLDLAEPQK